MRETSKTNQIRGEDFLKKYLSGKVIDIGSGDDLVCLTAERFDKYEGDANHITKYREPNTYDAVHSSHCLEHMLNPKNALEEWWKLIKPGGFLVLVVPDEDLYEQGFWPSRFNRDHKVTFTIRKEKSWSPVSYNIFDLVESLPSSEVISIELQDKNYNYQLQTKYPPPPIAKINIVRRAVRRIIRLLICNQSWWEKMENRRFYTHNVPVDQTMREAVAQIQVIVRKVEN
ncbi:methyltransferase domain-containing protein [Spirobacillus cienkowskii]|uniref:methyltransferase domain-containing protein n=1 Tax=Spirobacillus cienkowskii TaxID=495820 RepID=UPI0030CBB55C